ncbi:hypothetical protein MNBD_GAMMA22-1973 [hydrothermal vent metagenome]|uniref:DUF4124 domain-containing protein n=1 Tax=hydrothermal vent metagenome TaxID=652676 RepID=A0A3B1ABX4_9ZZZZ
MIQLSQFSTIFLLCNAFIFANPANAGIKCWKTTKGVRECGYQVPTEYRDTRIEILNKSGIVVRVLAAPKNAEQLAEEARHKKELAKIAERKRKDRLLLRTFTTERDLIIARDNRLTAVQSLINITQSNNNNVQYNLRALRERAGDFERSGTKLPKSLIEEIKNSDAQILYNNRNIEKRKLEVAKIIKSYKLDLERFRYLKKQQKSR